MFGHKTDPYSGMVRFNTSTPGSKSSAYLTFRVMHQDSSGWIIPAKPGKQIAQGIAGRAQGQFGDTLRQVLAKIGV